MKLVEFLKTIDSEELIAIGASSSYLYFGSPKNISEIESVSKDVYMEAVYSLNSTRKSLKNLSKLKDELKKKMDELFETYREIALGAYSAEEKKKSMNDIEKEIRQIFKRLTDIEHRKNTYSNRIKKLNEYKKNYISLLEREVINHYRQKASDYAYVIIIEGEEIGHYWTKQEYDSREYDEDLDEAI